MRITITSESGDQFINLDVDASMELENVKALLEAESGIPTTDQLLFFSGRQLLDEKQSLLSYEIKEDDMLLLRRKSTEPVAGPSVAGRNVQTDAETMRRQLIGDPRLLNELRRTQPEFADAALNNSNRFREMLARLPAMQQSAQLTQKHEADLLNSDPYNIEAQRKIEEAIRQEAVLENMETAWENMPEAFGQVHMLYVNVEVNGKPVKAFVDSGAQATIMSPDCAERCGIMRLLDTRFAGMARGVGTAKILGRVHSAQLKMGQDLFLQCSFTIMEGKDVDLLFGLDMLKRYQACIDLQKDALVIQGREIKFLSEHELPQHFQEESQPTETPRTTFEKAGSSTSPLQPSSTTSFPGSGVTLGVKNTASSSSSSSSTSSGAPPNSTTTTAPHPPPTTTNTSSSAAAAPSTSKFPEDKIEQLIALGVTRLEAIKLLELTNGHVEQSAGLLFSGDF